MRPTAVDLHQGPPQHDVLIGQTIGNYLVTQKLGEGGMGSVYLAEHPQIGKKVALKVLHAEFSANKEVIDRFFTEAKAVNDIGHVNIVDIIDYGVIQQGRESLVYFIMEYLAGLTLSQLVQRESPIPPERALGIALQVADALAASHRCSIVHRDLKPDNIILLQRSRERDFVKLLDFGIAKLTGSAGESSDGSRKTRAGIVMGTPAYMSPEQCEGRPNVDHRTDIYALGVVLYEMLTGRVPFVGEGYGEILVQHLTQVPVPPSAYRMLPPHVELVVLKALEKRADLRYPTMDEFMRAMADPVGYVESNGSMQGFLSRQLMPSNAPLPPISRLTPPPMTGMMPGATPIPGSLVSNMYSLPTPTTMGQSSGQVDSGKRGKAGFVLAGVAVVAAAAVAIAVVVTKKTGDKDKDNGGLVATGSADAIDPGSAAAKTTPDTGSAGTSAGAGSNSNAGSNAAAGSNAGSDAGSNNAATGSGSGTGSAAFVGSGSATTNEAMIDIVLETTPPGATILVDGFARTEVTPATLTVPRNKSSKATIILRLKGHVDEKLRNVDLSRSQQISRALKKAPVYTNPGKGSGSTTTRPGGDGLARPGED